MGFNSAIWRRCCPATCAWCLTTQGARFAWELSLLGRDNIAQGRRDLLFLKYVDAAIYLGICEQIVSLAY